MKQFNKASLVLGCWMLCVSTTTLALPITIQIDSVTGNWTGATISNTSTLTGLNTNEIRWGNPANIEKSGYRFVGVAPPSQGPYNVDVDFDIGTFTHLNFPIYAPSISGAELTVDIAATVTNGSTQNVNLTSVFTFTHFETPNNGNPCAAGGSKPCPDLVSAVLNPTASTMVTIDGMNYAIDITGFMIGATEFTEFLTLEGKSSSADLRGRFTELPDVPVPSAAVPEPTTIALMGLGLAGIGCRRRQLKKV